MRTCTKTSLRPFQIPKTLFQASRHNVKSAALSACPALQVSLSWLPRFLRFLQTTLLWRLSASNFCKGLQHQLEKEDRSSWCCRIMCNTNFLCTELCQRDRRPQLPSSVDPSLSLSTTFYKRTAPSSASSTRDSRRLGAGVSSQRGRSNRSLQTQTLPPPQTASSASTAARR